jgi:hypothetical protein
MTTKLQQQEKLVKQIYRLRMELYRNFKRPYGNVIEVSSEGYDY